MAAGAERIAGRNETVVQTLSFFQRKANIILVYINSVLLEASGERAAVAGETLLRLTVREKPIPA